VRALASRGGEQVGGGRVRSLPGQPGARSAPARSGVQETSPSLLQKCALTLLSAATAAVPLSVAPVMVSRGGASRTCGRPTLPLPRSHTPRLAHTGASSVRLAAAALATAACLMPAASQRLSQAARSCPSARLSLPPNNPPTSQPVEPAHALLTAGDPIKNAQAILRYALPIDNKPIRQIQVGGGGRQRCSCAHQRPPQPPCWCLPAPLHPCTPAPHDSYRSTAMVGSCDRSLLHPPSSAAGPGEHCRRAAHPGQQVAGPGLALRAQRSQHPDQPKVRHPGSSGGRQEGDPSSLATAGQGSLQPCPRAPGAAAALRAARRGTRCPPTTPASAQPTPPLFTTGRGRGRVRQAGEEPDRVSGADRCQGQAASAHQAARVSTQHPHSRHPAPSTQHPHSSQQQPHPHSSQQQPAPTKHPPTQHSPSGLASRATAKPCRPPHHMPCHAHPTSCRPTPSVRPGLQVPGLRG